jgi:hypothetical protein
MYGASGSERLPVERGGRLLIIGYPERAGAIFIAAKSVGDLPPSRTRLRIKLRRINTLWHDKTFDGDCFKQSR